MLINPHIHNPHLRLKQRRKEHNRHQPRNSLRDPRAPHSMRRKHPQPHRPQNTQHHNQIPVPPVEPHEPLPHGGHELHARQDARGQEGGQVDDHAEAVGTGARVPVALALDGVRGPAAEDVVYVDVGEAAGGEVDHYSGEEEEGGEAWEGREA